MVVVVVVFCLSLHCKTHLGLHLLLGLILTLIFSLVHMALFCLCLEVMALDLTRLLRLPPLVPLVLERSCWLICGFLLLLVVGVVALLDLGAPWLHLNRLRVSVGALLLVHMILMVLTLLALEDLVGLGLLCLLDLLLVRSCLMGLGLLCLLDLLLVLVGLVVLGGSGC